MGLLSAILGGGMSSADWTLHASEMRSSAKAARRAGDSAEAKRFKKLAEQADAKARRERRLGR